MPFVSPTLFTADFRGGFRVHDKKRFKWDRNQPVLRSAGLRARHALKVVHLRTQRYTNEKPMETQKIGMREFRDKLATYLLESDAPLAITRHGDTVGYFIPTRRKRNETERAALKEAAGRWQEVLAAEGIGEEEALRDFQQWRADTHK